MLEEEAKGYYGKKQSIEIQLQLGAGASESETGVGGVKRAE